MQPERFVEVVAQTGYDAVELAPKDQWRVIRDRGLSIASANGHASIEHGLNRRENHERIADEIKRNLEEATKFEVANLICFSDNRDGLPDEEGAEITAEGLHRLAPLAEQAGVTLILELLNSRVDHIGYQCDRTDWGARVVEDVNSPRVKLLYDIYHMQIMEGDIIRTIRARHDLIGHYHTAGNPGRNDLDDAQEINYPAIFSCIGETGYSGYIGHEFIPKGDAEAAIRGTFAETAAALGSRSAQP
jgi:hydroxypyruvate isomerase